MVPRWVREGILTEEEAFQRKQKNPITRSLGGEADVHVDLFPDIQLQTGDMVLLCSDGLTRYARRDDIARLAGHGSLEEIADRMVEFANRSGGADNISVILVRIEAATEGAAISTHGPHRITPVPVDLDTLATEPEVRLQRRRSMLQIPSKYIPLLLILLVLACGLSIISAILIMDGLDPLSSSPSTLATSTGSVDPSDGEAIVPLSTLIQTQSLALTATFSPLTFTPTPVSTTETSSSESMKTVRCSYTVQKGDTIMSIGDKLKVEVIDPGAIKCADQNNGGCEYNAQKVDLIIPGWVLVIPGANRDQCIESGGKIIEPLH